jgi:hypothetical protein
VVHRRIAERLFRRHVGRRPDRGADLRQGDVRIAVAAAGRADRLGDPEVGDGRGARGEEDVVGLDVAMDDVPGVRVRERAGDVTQQAHRLADRDLALADPVPQRVAVHVGHREPRDPLHLARGQHRHHVRVLELRGEHHLAAEPLHREASQELGREDLDHHAAVEGGLADEVGPGHPATSELALERVRPGKGLLQAGAEVVHPWVRSVGNAQ